MRSRMHTRRTKCVILDTLPGDKPVERWTMQPRKALTATIYRWERQSGLFFTWYQFEMTFGHLSVRTRMQLWKQCLKVRQEPRARLYNGEELTLEDAFYYFSWSRSRADIWHWYRRLPRV